MKKLRFVDGFAGIGVFHIAMEQAGIDSECVFAFEYESHLQDLYEQNFGIRPFGDVRELDIETMPDFDILFFGFPCTPFTTLTPPVFGKGFDHRKGDLFEYSRRILEIKKPDYFLLENVPALKAMTDEYRYIVQSLSDFNYHMYEYILSPHQFGVPQYRKRIFILGSKDPITRVLVPKHDILDKSCTGTVRSILEYGTPSKSCNNLNPKKRPYIDKINVDKDNSFVSFRYGGSNPLERNLDTDITGAILTYPHSNPIIFDHEIKDWRHFSINECKKLQSIPPNIKFPESKTNSYRIVGNTINVLVARSLLEVHFAGKTESDHYSTERLLV